MESLRELRGRVAAERRGRNDAPTIIGMHSRWALGVAGVFVLAGAVVTIGSYGVGAQLAPAMVSLLLLVVGAATLLTTAGDPLPTWPAAVIALIPAVQASIFWPALPTPLEDPLQASAAIGGGVVLCAFLCVRGRVLYAWAGQVTAFVAVLAMTLGSHGAVSAVVGMFLSNAGVLVMATYFAWLMRPAVEALFRLRETQTTMMADLAASEAARIERAAQKARLDALARPVLSAIADGENLSSEDIARTGLLEALLRDGIRARGLDVPEINRAAWAARERGVAVQLLDDGGLDGRHVGAAARQRLYSELAACLDDVAAGTVVIRIQPPGREVIVTSVVTCDGLVRSREFDAVWFNASSERTQR
jgi:hypothetical protein